MAWWNQNRMGGFGYGGMQQPQMQGGGGNAQQSQWGGGYQPQQNFGGSPFGGGQQWQRGGQNWGGGYGYNQPQQQPYLGGMMGYQPEQRQSYGQFNQPQQGQYNQGGDMGFKQPSMNQGGRQAYGDSMSQGQQNFQGQLGRQNNQGGQKQFDFGQAAAAAQNGSLDMNAAKGYGASDEQMNQLRGMMQPAQQQSRPNMSRDQMAAMPQMDTASLMSRFQGGGWK